MPKIFWVIILKKQKNALIIFSIGAFGYGLIEIIWRGRTHWSMLLAGGLAFSGLDFISEKMKNCSLFLKSLAGCGLITSVEYFFGIIFNIVFKKQVWDYSKMPLNLNGQVCALYSFFWLVLSFIFIPITEKINKNLEK